MKIMARYLRMVIWEEGRSSVLLQKKKSNLLSLRETVASEVKKVLKATRIMSRQSTSAVRWCMTVEVIVVCGQMGGS